MNHCYTCAHWGVRDLNLPLRPCTSPKFSDGAYGPFEGDEVSYEYQEDGDIFVGPKFGCVHYEEAPDADTRYAEEIT